MNKDKLITRFIESYNLWKKIEQNGNPNDLLWTDGENLNMIRDNLEFYKSELKKILSPEELPFFSSLDIPPLKPDDYMVNADQILKDAETNFKQFTESFKEVIQMERGNYKSKIIDYVNFYKFSIENNDLVQLRNLNQNYKNYYESMGRVFGYSLQDISQEKTGIEEPEKIQVENELNESEGMKFIG